MSNNQTQPAKHLSLSLIALIIIVLSLPLVLYLVLKGLHLFAPAAIEQVNLYFVPSSEVLPPDSTFKIMVNTVANPITYARVSFNFDPAKVRLSSEITTSSMSNLVLKTSQAEANASGSATLVLTVPPQETPPTDLFELASFSLTAVSPDVNDTTTLQFDPARQQIVYENGVEAIIEASNLTLTLNYQESPTPTPTPTPVPTPTPTVTTTPSPEPTPTPTSVPTPTPTPDPGSCTCRSNRVTKNSCRIGYIAYCTAANTCICSLYSPY